MYHVLSRLRRDNSAEDPGVPRLSRGLVNILISAVIVVLASGAASFVIWDAHRHAFQEHEREATNLAVALTEQTARYVQAVDQAITEVRSWAAEPDLLNADTFNELMRSAEVRRRLVERRPDVADAPAISVIGADGEILNSSRSEFTPGRNVADNVLYRYLKFHDDADIVVGSPSVSRVTSRPSLFFGRRVNSADGRFLGLVVAVVESSYFSKFYQSISDRLHGAVTLLSRDGAVLVRYPDPGDAVGKKMPESSGWYTSVAAGGGSYRTNGIIDGAPALVVARPLREYALVVDVVVPESAILGSWHHQSIYVTAGAAIVAFGFIVLTTVITGQFQRQRQQNVVLKQASAALRESERKSRLIAEMSADWFWEQGPDLRFLREANIPLTTLPTDVGKTRWDFADSAMDLRRWDSHKADLAARRPFRDFRWERIQTDGKRRYLSTSGDPIFDETGVFLGYHGTGRDVTAEVEAAAELREAKDRAEQAETLLRDAVDSMTEGFVIYDQHDRLLMCNDTYREIHGRIDAGGADCLVAGTPLEDVLRQTLAKTGGGDIAAGCEEQWLADRLENYRRGEGTFEQRLNDGSWFLVTNRRMKNGGLAGLRVDITERKRSEERVLHMAHHDALTGLANRTFLSERLAQALNRAARDHGQFAVLALDLDRFKAINDGFGHAVGDKLLILVTARLKGAIRSSDTLARIGGDEFVVLQADAEPAAAGELAQRLTEALSQPFEMNDIQMRIGTSIGIALYPTDGDSAGDLLKNADTALYRAKSDRLSGFCFFEARMDLQQRDRWALERDLRLAIGTDQLRLHYQPIFASATRSIVGFEALLRWQHPTRGNIPPMSFIQIAEETGLVLPIGAWVLEEACSRAAAWSKPKRISVNLSAVQLRSGELAGQLGDILLRTGLSPSLLELEVTETMLINDHGKALDTLHELREMGVQIACDDFGTGYSSFSYIQKLAFDRIKMDQSFVRELGVAPAALRIVQAIFAMAHSLGMAVTAEGVETEQQFSILRAQGCDEIQGFLLARPMPAEAVSAVLRGDETAPAERAEDCRGSDRDGEEASPYTRISRRETALAGPSWC